MTVAIISGASSGMGFDFAKLIDQNEKVDEIWLIARRKEKLSELANTCKTKCRIFALDLSDNTSFEILSKELEGNEVSWLVNAAGLGFIGDCIELDESEVSRMIDINITALTKLTQLCLPYCNKGSHIVQFASSAAFFPQPNFAIYAASKSYVLSYSTALRKELKEKGVAVTTVCPGPVKTEFFDVAEKKNKMAAYKKKFMVKSEDVVALAYKDAKKNKPKSIYGLSMKCVHVLSKIIPTDWIMKFY